MWNNNLEDIPFSVNVIEFIQREEKLINSSIINDWSLFLDVTSVWFIGLVVIRKVFRER